MGGINDQIYFFYAIPVKSAVTPVTLKRYTVAFKFHNNKIPYETLLPLP